jgi:hypothetical protein
MLRDAEQTTAKEAGDIGTHPWPEYSARTANYVFSYNGDKVLKDRERWISNWNNIEKGITFE